MALSLPPFTTLSDSQLLETLHRLASRERYATAALVASLGEVDARRLYLAEGCSSLFTYCTRVLHLSEHAAYNRIEAARAARRFPLVLERLADGSVTLTAVRLLAPHLTTETHAALLDAVRHASKHDVERLIATLRPKPDVPATVRKLPTEVAKASPLASAEPEPDRVVRNEMPDAAAARPPLSPSAAPKRSSVQPLAPSRYKLQLTLDDQGVALLRRAQALVRHRMPDGDIAAIVTEGLRLLVEQLEKTKAAATSRPQSKSRPLRGRSRTIPAAVRRAVWTRDEGRCAFVGTQGRCSETAFLEFHHVRPYADGGAATVENVELRCRAHNQYEAEQHFGTAFPWTAREPATLACGWNLSWNKFRTETHAATPVWPVPQFTCGQYAALRWVPMRLINSQLGSGRSGCGLTRQVSSVAEAKTMVPARAAGSNSSPGRGMRLQPSPASCAASERWSGQECGSDAGLDIEYPSGLVRLSQLEENKLGRGQFLDSF